MTGEDPVPVTCLGCERVCQCVLVQALTPYRDEPAGGEPENSYEVQVNLFICRECLRDPLCPLAKFIEEGVR